MIPRSKADIQQRHRGLRRIAEHTVGVMGRTPDYMNVTYAGFAAARMNGRSMATRPAPRGWWTTRSSSAAATSR